MLKDMSKNIKKGEKGRTERDVFYFIPPNFDKEENAPSSNALRTLDHH